MTLLQEVMAVELPRSWEEGPGASFLVVFVMPDVRIPEREERRLPGQCNMQRKGSLLLTQVRALATTNAVVQGPRALGPNGYPNL